MTDTDEKAAWPGWAGFATPERPLMSAPLQIPGKLVERLRKQRQWTAAYLAKLVGTTQQTIDKIEKGTIRYSKYFAGIKEALNITEEMISNHQAKARLIPMELPAIEATPSLPLHITLGRIRHNVYRLALCPIYKIQRPPMLRGEAKAYAFLMPDDSMEPEFRAGDTLLTQPSAPLQIGASHVFLDENGDYTVRRLLAKPENGYYRVAAIDNNGDEGSDRVPATWRAHLIAVRFLYYEP